MAKIENTDRTQIVNFNINILLCGANELTTINK